jgi:glucokinase
VQMTHRPWAVDGAILSRRFAIPRVRVVNDLGAAARGLALLAPRDFLAIQPGRASPTDPAVILGVGTGLGVAYLVPDTVLPGEGGHVGFSPGSAEQMRLLEYVFRKRARVASEELVSGTGIAMIHEFLGHGRVDAAAIGAGALAGNADCLATVNLFTECLGNVAGDHALAVMARGGVFLAGGVVAKIAPVLDKERFRAAFCAKGVFSAQLKHIPVRVVLNQRLVLLGAARSALER